jgi:hypothetical protein
MKTDRKALLAKAMVSAIAVLTLLLAAPAFGGDPAADPGQGATVGGVVSNETAKVAPGHNTDPQPAPFMFRAKGAITGGVDPHGDSLMSIRNSLQQFGHPEFVLRLFLSLALAVGCAWVIAWHPRGSKHIDPVAELEERKALIILGVVGAVVAEISGTNPTLAFVIFGIGALLRFRTVLDNPKATGKAILVVVIGLACGMGSWTMAVFVTAFSWVLIYFLDSHLTYNMTIRLDGDGDARPLENVVQSLLLVHRCRLQSTTLSKGNKRLEFLFHMPAGLDRDKLEKDVRAKLPKEGEPRITLELL